MIRQRVFAALLACAFGFGFGPAALRAQQTNSYQPAPLPQAAVEQNPASSPPPQMNVARRTVPPRKRPAVAGPTKESLAPNSISLQGDQPPSPPPQGPGTQQMSLAPDSISLQNYQNQANPNSPPPPPTEADLGPIVDNQSLLEQRQQEAEERISALEARTAPKLPLIKLGGFFQLDNADYSQDAGSRRTYGTMQDGTGFRRARMQAYGSVTEFTNYIVEMDFASSGRPSFLDVWGEQTNLGWLGTVRIGQFRQPTTMDALTSVRHLEFMERSAAFQAMDPFRRVGIMSYNMSENRNTTWMGSVYRTGFTFLNPTTNVDNSNTLGDTRYGTFVGNVGGVSTAYRITHLLWYDEPAEGRYLLHVGGGFNYSRIGSNGLTPSTTNGGQYDGRTIPGIFVGDSQTQGITANGTPFVANTGNIPATSFEFYHLELAGQYGPAHFQAEWLATSLQTIGFGNAFLTGAYIQCGYFLTGENCGYNRQFGVMDYNCKPFTEFFGLGRGKGIGGWGAWETAFRWDYLSLPSVGQTPPSAAAVAAGTTNAGTSGSNANPGTLNMATAALNWWWNQYTRVQFNYINVWNNSSFPVYGKSFTGIFGARFQVEF